MNCYKIFNTVFWTTTAFTLIGASITVPLSAAATESSFLPAEFHAAASEATGRFKNELRLELAETIPPLTPPQINSVVATEQMDDVVQEDLLTPSHTANVSREKDT